MQITCRPPWWSQHWQWAPDSRHSIRQQQVQHLMQLCCLNCVASTHTVNKHTQGVCVQDVILWDTWTISIDEFYWYTWIPKRHNHICTDMLLVGFDYMYLRISCSLRFNRLWTHTHCLLSEKYTFITLFNTCFSLVRFSPDFIKCMYNSEWDLVNSNLYHSGHSLTLRYVPLSGVPLEFPFVEISMAGVQ